MGTFTNATQLAKRQAVRFRDASLTMRQAHKELATQGRGDFLAQTVGQLSEKQLRQLGHPYARGARILSVDKLKGYRGLMESEVRLDRDGQIMRTKSGKLARRTRAQVTRGKVSDLPINRQTGKLRRQIQLKLIEGRNPVYELYSDAPYAKYVLAVDGTRYMRPRGLLGPSGLLRRRHKARHNALVDPVRRSLRKP